MKNFNLLLTQAINSNIESFVKVIAEKYKLKSSELIDLWYGKSTSQDVEFESDSEQEEKKSSRSSAPASVESKKSNSGCQYKSTKGKNEGALCGSKVCSESSTGLYCKKHIKQEQKSPKKEATKSSVAVKKSVPVQKEEIKVTTEHVQKKITNFGVSKNNFGNYWNEQSGLVFDKVTKQAIGKQQQNGDVISLTKQDIEFCKMHNITYKLPTNIVSSDKSINDEDEESIDDDEDEDYDEDEIDEDELN